MIQIHGFYWHNWASFTFYCRLMHTNNKKNCIFILFYFIHIFFYKVLLLLLLFIIKKIFSYKYTNNNKILAKKNSLNCKKCTILLWKNNNRLYITHTLMIFLLLFDIIFAWNIYTHTHTRPYKYEKERRLLNWIEGW